MIQPVSFKTDRPVNIRALTASRSARGMHQLCRPMGLEDAGTGRLCQMGEPVRNKDAVRAGAGLCRPMA